VESVSSAQSSPVATVGGDAASKLCLSEDPGATVKEN
jgi:hypothetical protein